MQQTQGGPSLNPIGSTEVPTEVLTNNVESPGPTEKSDAHWLVEACAIFRRVLADKLQDPQPEVQELLAAIVRESANAEIRMRLQAPEFFPGSSLTNGQKAAVVSLVLDEMWEDVCARVRSDLRVVSLEEAAKAESGADLTTTAAIANPEAVSAESRIPPFSSDLLALSLKKIGLSTWLADQLEKQGLMTVINILNLSQRAFQELPIDGKLWRQELKNKLSACHPGLLILAAPLQTLPGFSDERCRDIGNYLKVHPVSLVGGQLKAVPDRKSVV